jgi:regulatory protein
VPRRPLRSLKEGEEYALRLLGIRDYSRAEMERKLTASGMGLRETQKIIGGLEARGLIDDQRYARRLAGFYFREKLWGPQKIVQKLLQKGIALELARGLTEESGEGGFYREGLKKILRSKLKGKDLREMLPREKRRMAGYLHRRGFPWEDVMEVFREAGGSTEE